MNEPVTVLERWTRDGGIRKIGNRPWEPIDLGPSGIVPFIIFNSAITWWGRALLVSEEEALALR